MGAAEEPEPEPEPGPPSSYDPRDYQLVQENLTKKGGGNKAKSEDDAHRCANCFAPDAKSKCGGCGVEWYCGRDCQKVRGRWAAGLRPRRAGDATMTGALSLATTTLRT